MRRVVNVDRLAARGCVACVALILLGLIAGAIGMVVSIIQRRWVSDWVFEAAVWPAMIGAALGLAGCLWLLRSTTASSRPGMTGAVARELRRGNLAG